MKFSLIFFFLMHTEEKVQIYHPLIPSRVSTRGGCMKLRCEISKMEQPRLMFFYVISYAIINDFNSFTPLQCATHNTSVVNCRYHLSHSHHTTHMWSYTAMLQSIYTSSMGSFFSQLTILTRAQRLASTLSNFAFTSKVDCQTTLILYVLTCLIV